MMNDDLKLLDETVALIKEKIYNFQSYDKFEFYLIMCLEIVRYELQTSQVISDRTAEAITQLFAFQAFEMYYRDHHDLYLKCLSLFTALTNYNYKFKNDELSSLGVKDKSWIDFFSSSISDLILLNKPNNI